MHADNRSVELIHHIPLALMAEDRPGEQGCTGGVLRRARESECFLLEALLPEREGRSGEGCRERKPGTFASDPV